MRAALFTKKSAYSVAKSGCFALVALSVAAVIGQSPARAQQFVSYTDPLVTYNQQFNTLSTGVGPHTWTNGAPTANLSGWYSNQTTYNVADPTSPVSGTNPGTGLFSFGPAGNNDRTLGSIADGGTVVFGVQLRNDTDQIITSLQVNFVGEQWYNSGAGAQTLAFDFGVFNTNSASNLNAVSGYTGVSSLNFTSPTTGGTATFLDGNDGTNQSARGATFAVDWQPGQYLWLRWTDTDNAGADHGLGIDRLDTGAFTFQPVPAPPAVTSLGIGGVIGMAQLGLVRFRRRRRNASEDSDNNNEA